VPKEFIESKYNSENLLIACRQQKQLSYFTESKVQDDVKLSYLKQWADRKYQGSDYFLNFVKSVFKTENFLLIYKYLRFPLPSARLINDKIKTPLKRVFFAEDSFFKYEINGELVKNPQNLNIDEFNEQMFNALLFRHNDILVVDLNDINSPYKSIISIENVISIDSNDSIINKIAYSAQIPYNGELLRGVLYIDDERYSFYEKENNNILGEKPILDVPHDLGRCPADYISSESFYSDNDIVRKSIFSYSREEMEEYVFLKTMQRMVEPNGAIPIVTQLDTKSETKNNDGISQDGELMSSQEIGNQKSSVTGDINSLDSTMQTGSRVKVPVILKDDGSVDMDVVKNYLNFFYIPTESLNYLNTRIKEVKANLISNILGDYSEGSVPQGSKSDLEASINVVSRQDVLRHISMQLSRIRTRSDYNYLSLQYGKDNVSNESFYGSDFFLETQNDLYKLIKLAPNPIEEKSLLIKSARNRNRFNQDNFTREYILYHLIPYGNIESFNLAVDNNQVGEITFQYQTRFNYWINLFEAQYGDILTFWKTSNGSENQKVYLINKLILIIIRENYEKSSTLENVPREGDS